MSLNKSLWLVYLGGFLLAVHYATIAYVNSSLLTLYVGDTTLNLLYVAGSILSIVSLFLAPFLLRKYGSIFTLIFFVALEIIAVFGMGSSTLAILILLLFLLHQAAESMLYFCLDVNLEQEIKIEGTTGGKRSIFLTVQNVAWVISPLALSALVSAGNFKNIYYLSGAALIPLFFIVLFAFKNTKKATTATASTLSMLHSLLKGGDTARILGTQFVLNFFYSWMIIYLPLLLSQDIGFSWSQIGLIFTIMLLPFILFEISAGFLSDKKFGETEILKAGFIIMALSTFIIPFLKSPIFWIWALILFLTRTGASLVEISSESYFFKHVKADDTGLISLFRMSRPLSFVIAPLVAIPVISFFSYSASFLFLSIITLSGLLFIPKVDTK